MSFYDKVAECDLSKDNYVATIVTGDNIGEKILYTDEEMLACTGDYGTLFQNISKDRLYIEKLREKPAMVICGAGHVSVALVKLAVMTGYRVMVIDDRPDFVGKAKKAGADAAICENFNKALDNLPGNVNTYFVIATRGHCYDSVCLEKIGKKPHAYIGILGSKRRVVILKQDALDFGVSPQVVQNIHAPIGLLIGAQTPEEIAVSIMAEIISVENGRQNKSGYDEEILKALTDDKRKILATIIKRSGSAPRSEGTKMVVDEDGSITGTIGGGCMEASVIQKARMILNDKNSQNTIVDVDMSNDEAMQEAMACGGRIRVLLEVVKND